MVKSATATITVTQQLVFSNVTGFTASPTSGNEPFNVAVGGTAVNQNGGGIATTVSLYLDGNAVSTVTSSATGVFSGSISITTPGTHHVAAGSATTVFSPSIAINGIGPITAISMSPSGAVPLVIPAGSTSVAQSFTGAATDVNGVGVVGQTVYAFLNGALEAQTTTGASGDYTFTVTFSAVGTDTFYVSSNANGT